MNLARLQELFNLIPPDEVQESKVESKVLDKTVQFYSVSDFVNDSLSDLNDSIGPGGTLSKLVKGDKTAAMSKAFVAFKKDIESRLTDIEVELMAIEAEAAKEGAPTTSKALAEAKDYDDSIDFTEELSSVATHINNIKQVVHQPRWSNWMQLTDDNFSTSCEALNEDLIDKVMALDDAFIALENELQAAC